jgi:hypothetical protein
MQKDVFSRMPSWIRIMNISSCFPKGWKTISLINVLSFWCHFFSPKALFLHSCVPLRSFSYIYEYFSNATISFVDWYEIFCGCLIDLSIASTQFLTPCLSFYDPGPHGAGRYLQGMKPEVQRYDFSKGAQVSARYKSNAMEFCAIKRNFLSKSEDGCFFCILV